MKINLTKEHILRESQKLFAKKGFSAVSMQDIARVVGIQKPSLYYFYKSKEHLFAEVMANFWENLSERLLKLDFGKSVVKKNVQKYFAKILEEFLDSSKFGGRAVAEVAIMKENRMGLCKQAYVHIQTCRNLLTKFLRSQKVPQPDLAQQIIANAIHMHTIHSQFEKQTVSDKAYALYLAKLFIKNN